MLQLTSRDEAMLDWMNVVRLADVEAIRWALSAYQDDHDGPVSVRRANHWIARMAELDYLGRVRPVHRDRQIVWPTSQSSGRSVPRLFRQTMRHELAVALVSGRYLAAGYAWMKDVAPSDPSNGHQADGVASRREELVLIEVELTMKQTARYRRIHLSHERRLRNDVSGVEYFCTPTVGKAVSREADKFIFRVSRPKLSVHCVLDEQGRWVGSTPAPVKLN